MNQFRQEFGEENVLLVDNGDLFQGTPVSQVQLLEYAAGRSEDPLAKCDRGRVCVTKLTAVSFVTQARPLSHSEITNTHTAPTDARSPARSYTEA